MGHSFHFRQQVRAQSWSYRERDDKRSHQGNDVAHPKRSEKSALKTTQRKEWDKDKNHDNRGKHNRVSHLAACFIYDSKWRLRFMRLPILSQSSKYVLDVHDGVVDQLTNRYRKTSECHGVDVETEPSKDDRSNYKGERNRCERDSGRSEIQEKQKENNCHQDRPVAQGLLNIMDRVLDEIGLLEKMSVDLHTFRKTCLNFVKLLRNGVGQIDRGCAGLFLNA